MKKIIGYLILVVCLSSFWLYSDANRRPEQVSQNTIEDNVSDRSAELLTQSNSIQPGFNADHTDLKTLEHQLASLQKEVAAIVHQMDISRNPDKEESTYDQAVEEPDRGPLETTIDQNEINSQTIATFDKRISSEAVDEKWSQWAENEIVARIDSEEFEGVSLVSNECYSTLCRIELSYDGTQNLDKGLNALSFATSWDAEGFFYVDEKKPERLVAFVAREGEMLHPTLIQEN